MATRRQSRAPADYAGYLKKRGGIITSFKKRWFELRKQNLFYFQSPTEKAAGFIDLAGCILAEQKDLIFNLSGPHLQRTYVIQAETEEEYKNWVSKIQNAIKNASPTGGITGVGENGVIFSDQKKKVGLEDFEILTVLGRGNFGKVMKVKYRETGEIFAMKVLKKESLIKENMVGHTMMEKVILQTIAHPFLVKLHAAFQTPEKLYLIMEFLPGGEMFFHLRKEGRFTEDKARFYAAEITLALEHLHKNSIIYRDLKPENCVLNKEGHVVVTDFGLAKLGVNAPTYTFCGTPEYLAPEMLKGEGHSKAVDWWSLGILIYEMLVGRPPFYSDNINEMYEIILKSPIQFPSHISPTCQSLLKGLLDRAESKRLGSTDDGKSIKAHPWFASIDWEKLEKKQIPPPFVPDTQGANDNRYFDKEFTNERAQDTMAKPTNPEVSQQFQGFTYHDPSLLNK